MPRSSLSCIAALAFVAMSSFVPAGAWAQRVPVSTCDADSDTFITLTEIHACEAQLLGGLKKPTKVEECNTDAAPGLTRPEIANCVRYLDKSIAELDSSGQKVDAMVDDIAGELLDNIGSATATFEQTQDMLDTRATYAAKQQPRVVLSDRVILTRKLSDALDPRKPESGVPFVVSYTDDRGPSDDAFVLAGEVTYAMPYHDFAGRDDFSVAFLPNLAFDLTTAKAPSESSITLGLPLRWVKTNTSSVFDDVSWSIEPKYNTDRDFRRDAYELAFGLSGASEKLARAGLTTRFGGDPALPGSSFSFSWTPSLGLEAGHVTDSGNNEKLEAIRLNGEYLRLAPSLTMKLSLPHATHGVVLSASHTQRFDLTDSWSRGLTSATFQYNLTNSVALTLTRRKGRKPPDFAEVDDVLFGLGLQQVPKN